MKIEEFYLFSVIENYFYGNIKFEVLFDIIKQK